jgi:transglutaminase-like putative cysteine protease
VKLEVRYCNRFTYDELVSESQNELRACPVDGDGQQLLDYRVVVSPSAEVVSWIDAWGTRVDAFGVRRPHLAMEVVAESSVVTTSRPLPAMAAPVSLLGDAAFREANLEYLERRPHTDWGPTVIDAAQRQVELAGSDVVGRVLAIHRFVGSHVAYEPGSTRVGVPVDEVLARARGVCQDYAHLAVAMCRAIDIPARYVSGYLFAAVAGGVEGEEPDLVHATTHAWFEAAIPGWGWLALDPTNREPVGERHVKIGHGRDYDDVLPFRGAYIGPVDAEAHAEVELRRVPHGVAEAAPSPIWRRPLPGSGSEPARRAEQ